MDNRQTTTISRHNNDIVACKVLKVQENSVAIPLPWGGTATLMITSDIFAAGDWVDVQLRAQRNNGAVSAYSAKYIGRTPGKYIPENPEIQFVTI